MHSPSICNTMSSGQNTSSCQKLLQVGNIERTVRFEITLKMENPANFSSVWAWMNGKFLCICNSGYAMRIDEKITGQTKSTVYGHEWNNFMNSLSTFSNRLMEKRVQKNFAAEILVIDLCKGIYTWASFGFELLKRLLNAVILDHLVILLPLPLKHHRRGNIKLTLSWNYQPIRSSISGANSYSICKLNGEVEFLNWVDCEACQVDSLFQTWKNS